ncbi:MAG: hypothetical protein MZW92_79425 [Comamonadaceae bacterium]|nr:hypothetical protein [Comamonadaceae bacterium]
MKAAGCDAHPGRCRSTRNTPPAPPPPPSTPSCLRCMRTRNLPELRFVQQLSTTIPATSRRWRASVPRLLDEARPPATSW